jgi:alkanesulfonate monooxygenase SsuD/methylene tetrahydromethanopterin reductase-like flavin-dependent oxidoreductase (luciferase family)
VARQADGWLGYFSSPDGYAQALGAIHKEADALGRDSNSITGAHYIHTLVDENAAEARSQAVSHLSRRYGQDFSDHIIDRYCLVGDPDHCRERVKSYMAAGVEHLVFIPLARPMDLHGQMDLIWSRVAQPILDEYGNEPVSTR